MFYVLDIWISIQIYQYKEFIMGENLFTTQQLAVRWEMPENRLINWRLRRKHIPFEKINDEIVYRYEDVKKIEGRNDENMHKPILSPEELASRWQIKPSTLGYWRCVKKEIPFIKIGGSPRYRMEDVEKYENDNVLKIEKQIFLSPKQLSERWDVAIGTFNSWNCTNKKIPFVKIGKLVRYRLEDILEIEGRDDKNINQTLISERKLAKKLGVPITNLRYNRFRGQGIPFIKIGKLVRYRMEDVEKYS